MSSTSPFRFLSLLFRSLPLQTFRFSMNSAFIPESCEYAPKEIGEDIVYHLRIVSDSVFRLSKRKIILVISQVRVRVMVMCIDPNRFEELEAERKKGSPPSWQFDNEVERKQQVTIHLTKLQLFGEKLIYVWWVLCLQLNAVRNDGKVFDKLPKKTCASSTYLCIFHF